MMIFMEMPMKHAFAILVGLTLTITLSTHLLARGEWEIGFHYGRWSLNLLAPLIEEKAGDLLEDNLRDEMLNKIREKYPYIHATSYTQTIEFDSTGSNFGGEIRYYPSGNQGSFSIGLGVEKSSLQCSFPKVDVIMQLESDLNPAQKGDFVARATAAQFNISPLSYHFNVRWDIAPQALIHPYITLGAGFFTIGDLEKGRVILGYSGTLTVTGIGQETISDAYEKTVKEALEESEDVNLPSVLPILQLNVGLKAMISENIHLLIDFGIWDGFLLRGGVGIRF